MRTSLPGAPLPLVLAVAIAAASLYCFDAAAADAVADSCNAIRGFVNVSFCVSRLGAVPGAAAADRHGHLLMAADLAAASGASAGDAAARMERAESDPAVRDALHACGFLYGVSSVPALRIMRRYAAARSWDAAHAVFMLAVQAGTDCDAALGSSAGRTMAAANHEFDELATMATALLNTFSAR
ncbi:unnamed protein product [Urochloa decumbens]|uniref:Pectinesterase inhibitor domain-containing protein n=1 Tax=Urochloa decumbens TaxID=240449 RepID=A0ABC8VWR8_9POAL